jgi:hypothetical protein
MSLLEKLRPRSGTAPRGAETVGHALVVFPPEGMSAEARQLASTLPADPDHDLVVADMPRDNPGTFWETLATALPRGRRGLRLVLASRSRELGALAGQWLSTRLGRTVVAPAGVLSRDLNGCMFVDAGPGSGWLRFRPGREPEREGKRFPRPAWESVLVNDPFGAGTSTAEPVPAGLWLRPDGERGRVNAGRNRLTHAIPCQPDVLTIALGGRDLPPLPLDDVAPLWEALPADDRARVRFVRFGPVTPAEKPVGQALADLLGEEVTCYTGMPVGPSDVYLLRPDGSHGWNAFVQQLSFVPGGASPVPRARRVPVKGLSEVAPGTYEYAPDVVVEVLLAGLWIRGTDVPAHAAAVRAIPVDPATNLLVYEDADPRTAGRMWTVAQEVLGRLDYSTRLASKPLPVTAVCELEPEGDVLLPWLTEVLDTASLPHPAVSKPAIDLRSAENLETARFQVAELLDLGQDKDIDAAALHIYLTGGAPNLDAALRAGKDGPHLDVARCAVHALLSKQPHRGGTVAAVTPTPAQWEFLRQHRILTELGFHSMLTAPPREQDGATDLLVWSMTARRTAPFGDPVPGRVLFLPGTYFKVVELSEERILLRELSATEIGPDGTVDENRRSLDQLAVTSLLRFAEKWQRTDVTLSCRLPGVADD